MCLSRIDPCQETGSYYAVTMKQSDRNFGSKALVLSHPEVSQHVSLDESSHSFPSVFSSPFTRASLCSFLLAMPTPSQSPPSTAFSSLSSLDFLSLSFSIKARNVSSGFDEQNHVAPTSSLMAIIATALQSFQSSRDYDVHNQNTSKDVFHRSSTRSSKRVSNLAVSHLGRLSVNRKEHMPEVVCLHTAGNGLVSNLGPENGSELSLLDARDGVETGVLKEQQRIINQQKAEKRAEKFRNISKYLVAGAVSTIVARTFVAPLERLKLEYIVGGAKHNWIKVVKGIWVAEGPAGFWKGNNLNLLRMVPFKSINFLTYDMFCKELLERQGKDEVTNSDRLLAGAVSGAAATLLCIPLDTVRTRLIAPGGDALGGMGGCFQQMIQNEGFLSLYKGLLPALLSMVPAGAVFYGVYDILKASYLQSPKAQRESLLRAESKGQRSLDADAAGVASGKADPQLDLGPVRTLIYGAIAGACAETVTYPLEVVRRQLQLQQATTKMGLISAFQTIIERDGFGALFAGVIPSTVQVLPSAALSYLVYEFMKSTLKIS